MSKLHSNKAFKLGIYCGILIYFVVYIIVYAHNLPPKHDDLCFDCDVPSGIPFTSYVPGNSVTETRIVWLGLIANILAAIFFILGVGLISNFIASKIFSQETN